MKWFEGTIPEAIAASKAKHAIFVVFIEGSDNNSKTAASVLESDEVSTKLSSDDFVSIRLQSDSDSYKMFSEIYHLVPVPSLFFIGDNGMPIEVVAGCVSAPDLITKLAAALEKHKQGAPRVPVQPLSAAEAGSTSRSHTEAVSPELKPSSSKQDVPEKVDAGAESGASTSASTSVAEPNQGKERVDRAKELLEQRRLQKQKEDEEKERTKEIERRKLGHDLQQLRRMQQDQELKELLEQRKKDKAEEAAAREKVRLQIAQDRADRAARARNLSGSPEPMNQEQQGPSEIRRPVERNTTRIQFRYPDGTSHTEEFAPTMTLGEVRQHIRALPTLPFRNFEMSTSFPRRVFTDEDSHRTLQDLELFPSAVILIFPEPSMTAAATSNTVSVFRSLFFTLLSPLFAIYGYVRNWITGGNANQVGNNPANASRNEPPSQGAQQGSSGNRGARQRSGFRDTTTIHRQGNIHRLSNHRDSDDENNTWNGNSTQQM